MKGVVVISGRSSKTSLYWHAWRSLTLVLPLTLTLSACVTTQGGGSTSGFPQLHATALTDFFSSEVREFKTLMNDGKTDQALAFFKDKAAYFDERYASAEGNVPPEFTRLAEHVLTQEWQPSLLTARLAVMTVFGLGDAKARDEASAAWKNATERLEAVEGSALYKITRVGRDEVAKLSQARDKFKADAQAQKANVAPDFLDAVLQGTGNTVPFVGPVSFEAADFQGSPGFQTAAVARLNAATAPAEVERLARRLEPFLTAENQARADQRHAETVRQAFMADGRISLDELGQIAQMKPPLGKAPDALKGIVKVGYANISRSTLQGRVAPEFPVSFREDYGLPLTPAFEALRGNQPLDSFDFILVVDVANAVTQRNVTGSRPVFSRYVSGKRREPNPDYPTAERALREAQQKKREFDSEPLNCRGLTASNCNALIVMRTYVASQFTGVVNSASERLDKTPRMLEKTDYASYSYQTSDVQASKSAELPYHLIDVKGKRVYSGVEKLSDKASFRQVANVHAQDENRTSALSGTSSDADIQGWVRRGMETQLSSLFAPSNMQRASFSSFDQASQLSQLLAGARTQANATSLKDDPPSVGGSFKLPN